MKRSIPFRSVTPKIKSRHRSLQCSPAGTYLETFYNSLRQRNKQRRGDRRGAVSVLENKYLPPSVNYGTRRHKTYNSISGRASPFDQPGIGLKYSRPDYKVDCIPHRAHKIRFPPRTAERKYRRQEFLVSSLK